MRILSGGGSGIGILREELGLGEVVGGIFTSSISS